MPRHSDAPADFTPRYPGSGRLADKVAFISGAGSGIGRATARLFAREGARVVIPWHGDEEEARRVSDEIARQEGAEVLVTPLDAGKRQSCFDAIGKTVERFGRIDVLVCNAGVQQAHEDVTKISETDLERLFRVNVFGYLWLVQAALPHMEEGAAIICTTSATAYVGNRLLADYSASKGAEVGLIRALAANLADKGIRVNGVAPGPVWTPLVAEAMPPEDLAQFGTDVPMGRPAQPWEIAPAFLFLACEDGSYVTGQVIHPNGGMPVAG